MASQSGGGSGGGGGGTPSVSGYESPMVRQELAKLDKGGEKRRSAMACLRACVETLDPTTFPRFLSQVGDARDVTNSRADTISLFLDIARVHGRAAVPEIPRMMGIITRSLASSGSSIHLHEVCAKAVAALLRYSISPFSAMADAAAIFPEICQPLLDVLSAKLEPLAAGAAACLQAAVESEKWKYAPAAVAAEVCSRSCTSLKERSGQTVGHIHLVRSLVRAGAVGTDSGVGLVRTAAEMLRANQAAAWQQRAAALQLIRALLTSLDKKSLAAESEAIGEIIEHIRRDRMPHVRSEAAKALQALKTAQLSSSLSEIDVKGGGGGGANKLEDGAAEVMRSCTGSAVRSASKRRFFRSAAAAAAAEEEVIVSQESQVISLCLVSPDSSSPMSRRGRRRYPPLSPAQRRGGSSNSSSICTSEDADAMDSFVRFEEPCLVNGIEGKKLDLALDESFLDDQCAASSESCVIDDSEEVAAEFYGEGPATAKSTNGRYGLGGQSPASTISTADGDDDRDDLAKFAVSDAATPERSGVILTAEDFTQYTTPRRLVRSLQALVSSPDSDPDETLQEDTVRNDAENEQEESGDAAWSVRDNPIADQDSFNDRHRHYNQQPPPPPPQQQHGECDAPVFQDENEEQEQHGDIVKLASPASSKKSIMLRKSSVKKKMAWKKTAREWIEVLLGGLLVVVLLMSVAMVVAMVVFDRQDVGLVPT